MNIKQTASFVIQTFAASNYSRNLVTNGREIPQMGMPAKHVVRYRIPWLCQLFLRLLISVQLFMTSLISGTRDRECACM